MSEYKLLCKSLSDYIGTIDTTNINKKSKAYEMFSEEFNEQSDVVNFNYTQTAEEILKTLGLSEDKAKEKVHYIHGNVANNNIIFGVDDKSKINDDDTFLYKSTKSNYNGRILVLWEFALLATR